jgi:hypothetical protein
LDLSNFDMVKVRDTAWSNATTLWALKHFSADRRSAVRHLKGLADVGSTYNNWTPRYDRSRYRAPRSLSYE